jgi:hypothetical protein
MGMRYNPTLVMETLADMQAAYQFKDGQIALLVSNTARADSRFDQYYWDADSTSTDTSSSTLDVIQPNDADGVAVTRGRWLLLGGPRTISITANATLTIAGNGGKTMVFNSADGDTVTLPAAVGSGAVYKFVVGTTVTSNSDIIQAANATDEFVGTLLQTDTDTSDTLASYPALDGDGFDTVTLNGSTTGGIQGDVITLTDIASGKFLIEGHVNGTGTVATPLSAAVS